MSTHFTLPPGLIGRFGVIKLWPDIQVAEDEVIARLVNTARLLGLECTVLDHMGRDLKAGGAPLTGAELDFVIHLHFSTPKSYDVFSFVTLWNPTAFLHDFGYRPTAANLLTHDDFLSCLSPQADLHARRLIRAGASHLAPHFTLFHSLSTPVLPPTIGEGKVFYLGINWERLGQGRGRHQEVLNRLEPTGLLRIYGPETLRGVRVWEGFESYQRPLPFDGVSVIEEIHRAGICLALSSEPHKDAALMSNRLFEGLAAGALVICDENAWAREHFGSALLYVDLRDGAEATARRIEEHVAWAVANREEALALAGRAQGIFRARFTMDASLAALYAGLRERKAAIAAAIAPPADAPRPRVVLLAPDPGSDAFDRQAAAARAQLAQGHEAVLLTDAGELDEAAARLAASAPPGAPAVPLRGAAFLERDGSGQPVWRNRIGPVLRAELEAAPEGTPVLFLGPNETAFSEHVAILAGTLARHPEADLAWSRAILRWDGAGGEPHFEVERGLDLLDRDPVAPIGIGRFLFRAGPALDAPLRLLLDSLDIRAASGLALYLRGQCTNRASITLDRRRHFHLGLCDRDELERDIVGETRRDLEAIRDLDPVRYDALDAPARLREEVLSSLPVPAPVRRYDGLRRALRRLPVPDPVWLALGQVLRRGRAALRRLLGRG